MIRPEQTNAHDGAHTRFYNAAIVEVGKFTPQTQELAGKIFELIDQQGFQNHEQFASTTYPGVIVPITHVSVAAIAKELLAQSGKIINEAHINNRFIAEFGGWPMHPSGHAFDQWSNTYHHALTSLPAVISQINQGEAVQDVVINGIGYPQGLGGKATPEFVEAVAHTSFSAYGNLYQEVITSAVESEGGGYESVLLEGVSMGGAVARETAAMLDTDYFRLLKQQKKMQLLLYVPAGSEVSHNAVKLGWNALRGIAGGFIEDKIRRKGDKYYQQEVADEQPFRDALAAQLPQPAATQANWVDDIRLSLPLKQLIKRANFSPEQALAVIDVVNLVKGQEPPGDTTPTYEIQGKWNAVNFTFPRARKSVDVWINRKIDTVLRNELPHTKKPQLLIGVSDKLQQSSKQFLLSVTHNISYRDMRAKRWGAYVENIAQQLH